MLSRFTPSNRYSCLLLTLLVAVVFGNTLGHGFVWDDQIFVTYKEAYRNFDLATIFFSLKANELEYLPVRDLTYALDFALWGKTTAGFHFSNIVWYWLNVIVVYHLSARIAALFRDKAADGEQDDHSRTFGLFAAALFAVHPIHCEAVNFITCRNALVSGFFFFFSCLCYLQYLTATTQKKLAFYWAALGCLILALFAKATGIILPGVLLLFTCYFGRPNRWQRWLALLPFFLISGGGFFLFRAIALKTRLMPEVPSCTSAACLTEKAAIALQIPFFYLYKLLVPAGYTVDYDMERFGALMSDPRSIIALVLLVGSGILAWHFRRKEPLLLFCSAWYLIAMIPVLHIFPTVPVVADRYAFLPSLPFVIIVASAAVRLMAKRRVWLDVLCLLTIAGLSVISVLQNRIWNSDTTLWEYTLRVNPRSTAALGILARHSFQHKDYAKALDLARKAYEVNNNDFEYDRLRGELFLKQRRPDVAVIMFQSALSKSRESVEIMIGLGRAYEMLGDSQMAKLCYRSALNSREVYLSGDMRERAELLLRNLEQQ